MVVPPLAEKFRPTKLSEVVGQDHLLGPGGAIQSAIESKAPRSFIFWGPPGCGKTTLAKLYARAFGLHFVALSAVFSGINDIKKVVKEAEATPLLVKSTLLFVDEIHRFNKAQQDAFLPYIEQGTIILVGATTENPSFSLNNALLSRASVLKMQPLEAKALNQIIERYETEYTPLPLDDQQREQMIDWAQGDARALLNMVEAVASAKDQPIELEKLIQRRSANFDRSGDGHYDTISALHKSVRASDPDAALYWLARMLEGGEAPLFITRRIIRMAVEDIGLADPHALGVALQAQSAYETLGSPEGELAIAQAVIYLALAPKSNAAYVALKKAMTAAKETTHLSPSMISVNAPTKMMKEQGYAEGYLYDHDTESGCAGQSHFPKELEHASFYKPVERGFEREMQKRLTYFASLRKDSP